MTEPSSFTVNSPLSVRLLNIFLLRSSVAALLPWMLLFCVSNALMEELWFRGIFLNPFEHVLGAAASLILTSIVFTGTHVGATYLSRAERIRFLAILLPLALAWGFTTMLTDSLIGSTLFHAGADLLVLNGFVAAAYGRKHDPLGVAGQAEEAQA